MVFINFIGSTVLKTFRKFLTVARLLLACAATRGMGGIMVDADLAREDGWSPPVRPLASNVLP